MGIEENKKIIEHYYKALGSGDFETLSALHSENITFNVVGKTPVSGRWVGQEECFGKVVQMVAKALDMDKFRFAVKWKIVCADEDHVVGLMQAGGYAANGEPYNQTYCMVFTLRDGLIVETHEFFDTVLAERALFNNSLEKLESEPPRAFDF